MISGRMALLARLPALLATVARGAMPTGVIHAQAATAAPAEQAFEVDRVTIPPVFKDYRPARISWGNPDTRRLRPIALLIVTALQRMAEQALRHYLRHTERAQRRAGYGCLRSDL